MISLEQVKTNEDNMSVDNSKEEYKEVIKKSAEVLTKYSGTPRDDRKIDLSQADDWETNSVEYIGNLTTDLMKDPDFVDLSVTAQNAGFKGYGIGVHCLCCCYFYGAEAITMWDPSCSCMGRIWNTKIIISEKCCRCACAANLGLGITFYNKVPVSGTIVGLYWSVALVLGVQVEWFLTVPETSDDVDSIPIMTDDQTPTVTCQNKGALRVSLLLGVACTCCLPHAYHGTSKVCNSNFTASTYTITPQNLQVGVVTDLKGTITNNEINGSPVNFFQNNSDSKTTLKIVFPSWLSDCFQNAVQSDDNVDDTQVTLVGLDSWNNLTVSTSKFPISGLVGVAITLTYNGTDQSPWDTPLQFTIQNAVNNTGADPQNNDKSTYLMSKLTTNVTGKSEALGETQMSLQADIFNASMTFTVNVDGVTFTISNNPSNDSLSGTVTITNSTGNAFYYIQDQGSNVAITETDTGNMWDMGYEFQQESGGVYQIRPVMRQDGEPYTDRYKYLGVWVNIQSTETESSVYWNSDQSISLKIQVTLSDNMDAPV